MTILRQKELLCNFIWAYMRLYEELQPFDLKDKEMPVDTVKIVKKTFNLTDSEIKQINQIGKKIGVQDKIGYDLPIITNM